MPKELNPDYVDGLARAIDSAHQLFVVLTEDVGTHVTRTTTDDMSAALAAETNPLSEIQQSRRDYVRACFACIEALCFSMKSLAQQSLLDLPMEDQLLCTEKDFEIADSGKVKVKKRKISFCSNLKYSFDVICRSFEMTNTCCYQEDGFRGIKASIIVRDRLMHPKRAEDCLVSRNELVAMVSGFAWFTRHHQQTVTAALNAAVLRATSSSQAN